MGWVKTEISTRSFTMGKVPASVKFVLTSSPDALVLSVLVPEPELVLLDVYKRLGHYRYRKVLTSEDTGDTMTVQVEFDMKG